MTEPYGKGRAIVLRADARSLPLADNSVDLIVTSPPYFALRSYTDGGEHYSGQIGSEATPAEFIEALLACTREWMRVLKPTGSLWVNLGDKYSGAGPQNAPGRLSSVGNAHHWQQIGKSGIPSKSLMGIPWRYALRCIDELGLILRAEVIWSKPNGLPESVRDRVRRSHEQWFHLTLSPRYFSAVDEIREQYAPDTAKRYAAGYGSRAIDEQRLTVGLKLGDQTYGQNPLGKLPGSVWEVATEPLTVPEHLGVDHFAAFPTEFPRRIIQGWSPSGICTACGEGRRPLSGTICEPCGSLRPSNASTCPACGDVREWKEGRRISPVKGQVDFTTSGAGVPMKPRATMARASSIAAGEVCACPNTSAPTRPAVVVDPFGGTGTTALVASVLGRVGISVDMSADYCRLARWRTADSGQRAKAMRVDKPEPVLEGQLSLLDEVIV